MHTQMGRIYGDPIYFLPKRLKLIMFCHPSDNASCFTSSDFQDFLARNGIRHITAVPYYPVTNGLAERTVQTFKRSLKKPMPGDIETQLA